MVDLIRKDATSTVGGELTTGAQTIVGAKTFTSPITGFVTNNSYSNLVINGNMDFWQRGTTFTSVASGTYTADRLRYFKSGTMVHDITRSTDVPTFAQSGVQSSYSALLTVTTAQASLGATDQVGLQYNMEGLDYSLIHGQSVRLQFWTKCSTTGSLSVSFNNSDGTRAYATTVTINAANTWEKKTIDLTMDTTGTWLFDNQKGLAINFALGAGTSRSIAAGSWQSPGTASIGVTGATNFCTTNGTTFRITQIALIPGSFPSTASLNFVRAGKTIQQELAMCQRYYWQKNSEATYSSIGSGVMDVTNTNARISVIYPVTMRAIPSSFTATNITNTIVTQAGDLTPSGIATSYIGSTSAMVVLTTNAGTTGRGAIWLFTPTTPASVQADAEL